MNEDDKLFRRKIRKIARRILIFIRKKTRKTALALGLSVPMASIAVPQAVAAPPPQYNEKQSVLNHDNQNSPGRRSVSGLGFNTAALGPGNVPNTIKVQMPPDTDSAAYEITEPHEDEDVADYPAMPFDPGGHPLRSFVSSPFGEPRIDRDGHVYKHAGIDLAVPIGTPFFAMEGGRVETVVNDEWGGGYGRHVFVRGNDGLVYLYAHASRIDVEAGQIIKKGQQVILSGQSGDATGPHVHVEIRKDGVPINPKPILFAAENHQPSPFMVASKSKAHSPAPIIVVAASNVTPVNQPPAAIPDIDPKVAAAAMKPYRVNGHAFKPQEDRNYDKTGTASWYGPGFYGLRETSGHLHTGKEYTIAHRTLPLGARVRVTNLENGKSLVARVMDRGPVSEKYIADLSHRMYREIGAGKVRIERLPPEDDPQIHLVGDVPPSQPPQSPKRTETMVAETTPDHVAPVAPQPAPAAYAQLNMPTVQNADVKSAQQPRTVVAKPPDRQDPKTRIAKASEQAVRPSSQSPAKSPPQTGVGPVILTAQAKIGGRPMDFLLGLSKNEIANYRHDPDGKIKRQTAEGGWETVLDKSPTVIALLEEHARAQIAGDQPERPDNNGKSKPAAELNAA